ncbi:hypothetical protein B5X24_HaOG206665 [Helicoverpa armigera]|nr:hypothetical protein B5X24_HaOG206665 [Helicoverpa armigera]
MRKGNSTALFVTACSRQSLVSLVMYEPMNETKLPIYARVSPSTETSRRTSSSSIDLMIDDQNNEKTKHLMKGNGIYAVKKQYGTSAVQGSNVAN